MEEVLKVLAQMLTEQADNPVLGQIVSQLKPTAPGLHASATRYQLNKYLLSQQENALRVQHQDGRKVFTCQHPCRTQ